MLAASTIGLIVPAAESAGLGRWWLILIGVVCGMLFLNLLDLVTPHLHKITGIETEEEARIPLTQSGVQQVNWAGCKGVCVNHN